MTPTAPLLARPATPAVTRQVHGHSTSGSGGGGRCQLAPSTPASSVGLIVSRPLPRSPRLHPRCAVGAAGLVVAQELHLHSAECFGTQNPVGQLARLESWWIRPDHLQGPADLTDQVCVTVDEL